MAAVITGTLVRCRVYRAWTATSVELRAADSGPVWLSVDGEVATAQARVLQAKRPGGLLVYRRAAGHTPIGQAGGRRRRGRMTVAAADYLP